MTCIDPNPNFERFLIKSLAENRHLQFEGFLVAAGENMCPVASGSMDVVVCTLVLCSLESQERILREVCRVLRPVSDRCEEERWERPIVTGYLWTSDTAPSKADLRQVMSLIPLFIIHKTNIWGMLTNTVFLGREISLREASCLAQRHVAHKSGRDTTKIWISSFLG